MPALFFFIVAVTAIRIITVPVHIIIVDDTPAAFTAAVVVIIAVLADRCIFIGYRIPVEISFSAVTAGKCFIVEAVLTYYLIFNFIKFFLISMVHPQFAHS